MWVCDECLKDTDTKTAIKSRGPCEVCGKTAVCNDVLTHFEVHMDGHRLYQPRR